ncbi:MAG TPA: TolC family protein [Sulfuricurvum sp.]|nr:TolC family protein [Sulfuricurvum sp.]
MKHYLLQLFTCTLLLAEPLDLATLFHHTANSHALKARQADVNARYLQQSAAILPDTASLGIESGYADAKTSSNNAVECHVTIEKPLLLADTDHLFSLLKDQNKIEKTLEHARLANATYAAYIDACELQEELWLLQDALARGEQMTRLIHTGMRGGEFDKSAWLRSRLNVRSLTANISTLESRYRQTLLTLGAQTQLTVDTLSCSDLPDTITVPPAERFDNAPLMQSLEKSAASADAFRRFSDTAVPAVTLGAGYDNEMDLQRGIVYAAIPLGGARRDTVREAARARALAAHESLQAMHAQLRAKIDAFLTVQQTRKRNLQQLNDIRIPEAYEATVLLEARFKGSEASYLEYIDSQKTLFSLLEEGVRLRARALRDEAALLADLGLFPTIQKDTQ